MEVRTHLLALALTAFVACSNPIAETLQTSGTLSAHAHAHYGRANPLAPFLDENDAIAAGNALGIGSAALEGPSEVEVRSVQSLTLVYTAGKAGILSGGGIRVALRHLLDFSHPQLDDPTGDGYVTVQVTGDKAVSVRIEPEFGGELFNQTFPWQNVLEIGLPVQRLEAGEEIRVRYGDRRKGSRGMLVQSFDEPEYGFKVYVDALADGQYLPIESPPTLNVVAASPGVVNLVMPSDAVVGKPTWVIVRAEDAYGNPTFRFEGSIRLETDAPSARLPASVKFAKEDGGVRRVDGVVFNSAGNFTITASTDFGKRTGNPVRVRERRSEYRLLWGDLHGHTIYSDGRGSVTDFYDFAKNTAGLDFCAVTDHAFEVTDEQWADSKKVTNTWNQPGEFVTFQAYEWSGMTNVGGDHNVFFLHDDPPIFRSRSFYDYRNLEMYHGKQTQRNHIEDLFASLDPLLGERDVFAIPHWGGRRANPNFHHPELQRMIEIFSEHQRSDEWAMPFLSNGYRLGIIASTDGHYGNPGYGFLHPAREGETQKVGLASVAVYAQEQTREGIFRALYDRQVYATSGKRIILWFAVDGHMMGSEYTSKAAPQIAGEVVGTADIERIEINKNSEVVQTIQGTGSSMNFRWTDANFHAGDSAFYFVRVFQADGEEAVSSPVWVSP
jgi:hypothetical protein